jgi:CHAD domain-containing protein
MISRCYDDVAKLEPYISDPDCITEIHLLRIAIKRLRYSVEIFSPLYPDGLASAQKMLRKAQEMTGDIHDCDVWILYILDFIAKERMKFQRFYGNKRYYSRLEPGIQYFKQDRTEHRNDTYQNFVSDWQKWKEDKILEITLDVTRHYVVTDNYQYHPAKSSNH